MKKLLFIVLAFSPCIWAAESPAKRRKLFDLPLVSQEAHVEEIPDNQNIECRYCFELCAGLEAEKKHTLERHRVIIGDVRLEGRGVRYKSPRVIITPHDSDDSDND